MLHLKCSFLNLNSANQIWISKILPSPVPQIQQITSSILGTCNLCSSTTKTDTDKLFLTSRHHWTCKVSTTTQKMKIWDLGSSTCHMVHIRGRVSPLQGNHDGPRGAMPRAPPRIPLRSADTSHRQRGSRHPLQNSRHCRHKAAAAVVAPPPPTSFSFSLRPHDLRRNGRDEDGGTRKQHGRLVKWPDNSRT